MNEQPDFDVISESNFTKLTAQLPGVLIEVVVSDLGTIYTPVTRSYNAVTARLLARLLIAAAGMIEDQDSDGD